MDSASREYYHTLELLKEELLMFKSDQNKLRSQISEIINENHKLTSELRENVEFRLEDSPNNAEHLKHELEIAIAAKNAAIEMWQSALCELEKCENLLCGKKSFIATELHEVDQRINQVKNDYTKGLNLLSKELSETRNELVNVKKDCEIKGMELGKLNNNIEEKDSALRKTKLTLAETLEQKKTMHEKLSEQESALSEAEKLVNSQSKQLSLILSKNQELTSSVNSLKEQNTKLKSQILIHEKDAKESLLTAQEAILQKKEIAYKEEHNLKEIEQLKLSISLEVEKASLRFKDEIKEVKKKSSGEIRNLMDEINSLHLEISERQSLFERATREKQAAESKLELLHSENASGLPVSRVVFEDMCKRLTKAEKTRDEFELKATSLETALKEHKVYKEQEFKFLQGELSAVKERLQNLLDDFKQVSSDKVKLCEEVSMHKKKCLQLEKESKSAKAKHENELKKIEKECKSNKDAYDEQLLVIEEQSKKTCTELQQMLEAQFKINHSWKEEMQTFVTKSETEIKDLCRTIEKLKAQNTELEHALRARRYISIDNTVFDS